MSWFGRKSAPSALERLQSRWKCAGCGDLHEGMAHLAAFAPDPWPGPEQREENAALRLHGDFLSEDFCVLEGKYFFIRGVLEIPVHGIDEPFGFGCWSTLSRANFDKYLHGFDDGEYPDRGPWGGWLGNRLADYAGTGPEPVWVYPQRDRWRPRFRIQDPAHPLAHDQTHGIPPERAMSLFEFYGCRPEA